LQDGLQGAIGSARRFGYSQGMGLGLRIRSAHDVQRIRHAVNRLIPLILLSLIGSPLQALPVAVADWLTTADGLPNPDVEAIVRDRAGYVWIGTRGGLVRHEGVRLNVLRRDPDRPGSLPGDNILTLMAAADGDVWAAISEQGVVRIRGIEVQHHWANVGDGGPLRGNYVWSLQESCDGAVWGAYATDGVVRIDPDSGAARHFEPGELGLPDTGFGLQLVVDQSCRLWLLRTNGLWRVEADEPFGFSSVLASGETGLPAFLSIQFAGPDRAYVTGSEGLLHVDLAADDGANAEIIESWNLGVSVNVARPADEGKLWLGMRRGLNLFDPATGQANPVQFGPESASLSTVQITDVVAGAEGEVWFGTTGKGVARLPPGWRGFHPVRPRVDDDQIKRVTSIAAGPDGSLWIGSANYGVHRLDPDTGASLATGIKLDAENQEVIGLVVDDDAVWSLDRRSLVRSDLGTGTVRRVIARGGDQEDPFEFAAPAGDGGIWLGSDSAYLLRLDASGQVIDRWGADAGPNRRISDSALRTIVPGPDGGWWLLGADALYRQAENGAFVEAWRPENATLITLAFHGDRLWIAADSTLESFRLTGGALQPEKRYTAGSGLPPGRVQSLVPRTDNLWLLMSIGLARLDTKTERFRLFSGREGLMQSEFNAGAMVELDDGRFAAGTNDGLLLVDPSEIQPAPRPPPVHLISVRAGDRLIGLNGSSDRTALDFGWRQNSLEFSFLALSYINPSQNRYRIRLSGWDDEWQELVGQTTRFFSNLASGPYEFEVQAANVDGVWNRAGDRVAFTIAPPPWRSAPAWIAYAVIALAVTGSGWRTLLMRRRRHESLRRAQAQQQLADRQRELLQRLNRSLEPESLARTIGEAIMQLTDVSQCQVGFLQADFPRDVWSFGDCEPPPARARFDAAVAGDEPGQVVRLGGKHGPLAAVWLPELGPDRQEVMRGRLDLFAQTAGQVLENARLLLDVRKLARKASEASEAKSEFLATMSHEIRTPLHGLLGMMELLEQGGNDPAQLDMLRTMRGSGRQLQRILNDVLDLSRIEAGRVELEERPFEVVPLLERVIDLHASNAFAGGLDLRLRISADLPLMAIGDADRIAQVLGNLVSNAIKFTALGWVELDARLDAAGILVLAISDSGPGIDSEVQAELFEPFTQLESASTRKHSGTGLGLAISQRLVDAMKGRMTLDSEPGRGSRFSVFLPLPGMRRQSPFSPALLEGLRLAVALPAADRRIVLRLARRWSLELTASVPSSSPKGRDFDALIYRKDRLRPDFVQACRDAGVSCWQLGDETAGALDGVPRLRAPLTESRLVGALMDVRFARLGRIGAG